MQIALLPAAASDRAALANLIQLYLYDFSEITGADVDERGCFAYPLLDSYWTEAERYPFLIRVDGNLAGFALVNRYSRLLNPFDGHAVAEFFVMRKYRRVGIGRAAAIQLFDRFPHPRGCRNGISSKPDQQGIYGMRHVAPPIEVRTIYRARMF